MDKGPESALGFRLMVLTIKLRDLFSRPTNMLAESGVETGDCVLDYGCGPGSYVPYAARMVGDSGRVYALDIHPLAVKNVKALASKRRLENVETILSDCNTGLPDESVDLVLLYDVFHDLEDPESVLKELHRVLKPGGVLSFSDHHMKDDEILSRVTCGSLFGLSGRSKRVHNFKKEEERP
jgi:ubiquinone/menaquinone biosynthesis C-methylase UbiE